MTITPIEYTTDFLFNINAIEKINQLVEDSTQVHEALVIVGDTAESTTAIPAITTAGLVTMTRTETNVNETTRPVWLDLDYTMGPLTAPPTLTDYHGVDLYGDVALATFNVNLSNAQLYLFESKATYSGLSTLQGNYAGFFEAANNNTGTVKDNVALRIWSRNRKTGHINKLYGLKMSSPTNAGTVDKAYGLYLGDVDVSIDPANNYSIYTGKGKVRFGGDAYSISTTSKTDVSQGRLLRVGDFGVGVAGNVTGIDLNGITTCRTFAGNNLLNAPTSGYYYVRTTVFNAQYQEQWASGLTSSSKDKIFRRVKDVDVWGAWKELTTV